jgi:hypothetical protein
MKNSLVVIVSLSLFAFLSCKKEKESSQKPPEKTYAVNFSVTGFTEEVKPISSNKTMSTGTPGARSKSLKDQMTQLTYVVYNNASGKELKRIYQYAERGSWNDDIDTAFGAFKDTLAGGDYTIVIIGSQKYFGINAARAVEPIDEPYLHLNPLPLKDAYMEYRRRIEMNYETEDTFFTKFRLVVNGQDINQEVRMSRIVGKLEVQVEDAGSYTITLLNEMAGYKIAEEIPYVDIIVQDSSNIRIDKRFPTIPLPPIYIIRTDKPLEILISGYDANRTTKRLSVNIYKNKRTIVRGMLYTKHAPSSFNVTLQDWATDSVEVGF